MNSMIIDISDNYLIASTTKEIWDSTDHLYSEKDNIVAIIYGLSVLFVA